MLDELCDDTFFNILKYLKLNELAILELIDKDIMYKVAVYISPLKPINMWKIFKNNKRTNSIIFFKRLNIKCITFTEKDSTNIINDINVRPFIKFTRNTSLYKNSDDISKNVRFSKYGYNIIFV